MPWTTKLNGSAVFHLQVEASATITFLPLSTVRPDLLHLRQRLAIVRSTIFFGLVARDHHFWPICHNTSVLVEAVEVVLFIIPKVEASSNFLPDELDIGLTCIVEVDARHT